MLSLTLVFSSCKKDSDSDPDPAPTKKDMLVGNNWVLIGYSISPAIDFDGDGTQENNLIPYFDACNLDDFIDMKSDNTYTNEEGPSKCDPNDPQVYETGVWGFNSDETIVIFTPAGGAGAYEYNISSLTSAQWVATDTFVDNGVTYTVTLTFN